MVTKTYKSLDYRNRYSLHFNQYTSGLHFEHPDLEVRKKPLRDKGEENKKERKKDTVADRGKEREKNNVSKTEKAHVPPNAINKWLLTLYPTSLLL